MSQKIPFNQITTPITAAPVDTGVFFHRLPVTPLRPEGSQVPASQAAQLWSLFLWGASDAPAVYTVYAVPQGGVLNPAFIGGSPVVAQGIVPAKGIIQLADGLPLRGPVDLYVRVTVQSNITSFWGYVTRGEPDTLKERRFLSGSAIGDQVTDFSGGQGIIVPADGTPLPVTEVLHDKIATPAGYNDEIVLEVSLFTEVAAARDVTIFFPTGPEILFNVVTGEAQRIFDGVPFAFPGELKARNDVGTTDRDLLFTGGFVRA